MEDGISKIIQRIGGRAKEGLIETLYRHLERSQGNSGSAQDRFKSKEKEDQILIEYLDQHDLWYDFNHFATFIDEGAEQKVFFDASANQVIKLNDGIFYVNWMQYLESLIVHNLLFPTTVYTLKGFTQINRTLYAAVTQPYIKADRHTELSAIRNLMINNGFVVKKNNDYIHEKMGLIMEDLHEENVLTRDDVLFFVDTVIYLK